MNTKFFHPMNIFSLIMIIIIIVIGFGLIFTSSFSQIINGTNRTVLGVIFLVYASVRGIRFYQLFKAQEDDDLL